MTRAPNLNSIILSGDLYAADVTPTSAFIYFEPSGIEHEHAAHYVKTKGVWTQESNLYGDLLKAIGGEHLEDEMLSLLGLEDTL